MYEAKFMECFSKVPVFRLADVSQLISNRRYARKFLKRMVSERKAMRIKKDAYTLHNDSLLVSTFLSKPSYITSVSALGYHRLITQISREVFCFTAKKSGCIDFQERINFIHTKHFFGFEMKPYEGFAIPMATPEKAIIDSISVVPLSVVEEAAGSMNKEAMVACLKKTGKASVIKRMGALMDRNGHDIHKDVKEYLNYRRILLDPLGKKSGKLNKKWRVIENI